MALPAAVLHTAHPRSVLWPITWGGAAPLSVRLNANGTSDGDGYNETFMNEAPGLTLKETGIYTVDLMVDDGNGGTVSQRMELTVGKKPPIVALNLSGNQTFYTPGQPIRYAVNVEDAEDGQLGSGIPERRVAFSVDYLAEGYDKVAVAIGHRGADAGAMLSRGEALIGENGCQSCHKVVGITVMASAPKPMVNAAGGTVELRLGGP